MQPPAEIPKPAREADEPPSPWKRAAGVALVLLFGTLPCLVSTSFLAVIATQWGHSYTPISMFSRPEAWDAERVAKLVIYLVLGLGIPVGASVALVRYLRSARRLAARKAALAAGAILPIRATTAAQCPYCKAGVTVATEAAVRCPACATAHHAECWREHGGCTTFACARGPRDRDRESPEGGAHTPGTHAGEPPAPATLEGEAPEGETRDRKSPDRAKTS